MSTPFLLSFAENIIAHLVQSGDLELSGTEEEVITFVADSLANPKNGLSLISCLAEALLACPNVDELFIDDERLKELVTDLPSENLKRRTP